MYHPTPEAVQVIDEAMVLLASNDSATRVEGLNLLTTRLKGLEVLSNAQHRRMELDAALDRIARDEQELPILRVSAASKFRLGLSLVDGWTKGADPALRRWSRLAMSCFLHPSMAIELWRTRGLVDQDPACRLTAVAELTRLDPVFDPAPHLEELLESDDPAVRGEAIELSLASSKRGSPG